MSRRQGISAKAKSARAGLARLCLEAAANGGVSLQMSYAHFAPMGRGADADALRRGIAELGLPSCSASCAHELVSAYGGARGKLFHTDFEALVRDGAPPPPARRDRLARSGAAVTPADVEIGLSSMPIGKAIPPISRELEQPASGALRSKLEVERELEGEVHVAFSCDGKMLAVGDGDGRRGVGVYDATSAALLYQIPFSRPIGCLRFSPNGTRGARAGFLALGFKSSKKVAGTGNVELYDASSGKQAFSVPNTDDAVAHSDVEFSLDGSHVAATMKNNGVVVVRTSPGGPRSRVAFPPDGNAVRGGGGNDFACVALDSDAGRVALSNKNFVTVWRRDCGTTGVGVEELYKLERSADVTAMSWSGDGAYFAVGGEDSLVAIMDTASWQPLYSLHNETRVLCCAFSRDSMQLAIGSFNSLRVVLSSGRPLTSNTASVLAPRESVQLYTEKLDGTCRSVCFNHNGRRIAVGLNSSRGERNGSAQILTASTGFPRSQVPTAKHVSCVSSAGGRIAYCCMDDGAVGMFKPRGGGGGGGGGELVPEGGSSAHWAPRDVVPKPRVVVLSACGRWLAVGGKGADKRGALQLFELGAGRV